MGCGGVKAAENTKVPNYNAIVLLVLDDFDTGFEIKGAPQSYASLQETLAKHFNIPESSLICSTTSAAGRQVSLNSDLLYKEAIMKPSPVKIRVTLLMSLEEYLDGKSLHFGESTVKNSRSVIKPIPVQVDYSHHDISQPLLQDSFSSPKGPFLVRVWQGFVKCLDVSTGDSRRFTGPIFDLGSRASVTEDGEIYVSGGISKSVLFCKVTVGERGVTMLIDLPKGRQNHAQSVYQGEIVVTGGFGNKPMSHCAGYRNGEWRVLPGLNFARYGHSSIPCGEKLYVFGGVKQASVECLESQKWTVLTYQVNVAHAGLSLISSQDVIIVGGGQDKGSAEVLALDLQSGSQVTLADLPSADSFCSEGKSFQGRIYFQGASHDYVFDLETRLWAIQTGPDIDD